MAVTYTYHNGVLVSVSPTEAPSPSTISIPTGQPTAHRIRSATVVRTHTATTATPTTPARHPHFTRRSLPCIHLGHPTGQTKDCQTCGGGKQIPIYACAVHGECSGTKRLLVREEGRTKEYPWCLKCEDYAAAIPSTVPGGDSRIRQSSEEATSHSQALTTLTSPARPRVKPLVWAYAVTTVISRRDTLLPPTLKSLATAGFDKPTLCVDGCTFDEAKEYEKRFGLPVEVHRQRLRVVSHWMQTLHWLWVTNPKAQRYAIFQDDLACVRGLREYLDYSTSSDARSYYNCMTFRNNEEIVRGKPNGWHEAVTQAGPSYHGKPMQKGLSAMALVFNKPAAEALLLAGHLLRKPHSAGERAHILVDGGIVESMNQAGFREQIHRPSLVQHTGLLSTIGHHNDKQALTYPGDGFDARDLIQ